MSSYLFSVRCGRINITLFSWPKSLRRSTVRTVPIDPKSLPQDPAILQQMLNDLTTHSVPSMLFPLELVRTAAADAHQWQPISFDAVKHLLLCRLEQKPPRLDLENYPHLPAARVAMTLAQDDASLLTEVA